MTDTTYQPQPVSNEDGNWAALAHLASLVNLVGIPSPLGPLLIWLIKRNESEFATQEAKESLNFTLSVWIYGAAFLIIGLLTLISSNGSSSAIITAVLLFIAWGLLILSSLVFSVMGAVKASSGKAYRYPMNLRIVK